MLYLKSVHIHLIQVSFKGIWPINFLNLLMLMGLNGRSGFKNQTQFPPIVKCDLTDYWLKITPPDKLPTIISIVSFNLYLWVWKLLSCLDIFHAVKFRESLKWIYHIILMSLMIIGWSYSYYIIKIFFLDMDENLTQIFCMYKTDL